jgi:hypothetical protein
MRDGNSSRIRLPLQPRRRSVVSMLAWHVLLNCVANPSPYRGGVNSSPVVRTDAVDAAIACDRNQGDLDRPGERMRAKERRTAGIAETYPARKLPRGLGLVDDPIQSGGLNPAPSIPLGRWRDFAAGTELCEPVSYENHGQSARSTRFERIHFREPCRTDAEYGLREECQPNVRDSRIRCVEDVLSRRITSEWWRTRRDRGVGDLFDNWTPGGGVERVRAQADKRLDEGRKGSER